MPSKRSQSTIPAPSTRKTLSPPYPGGGFVFLGKCKDLRQGAGKDDTRPGPLLPFENLYTPDHGADNRHCFPTGYLAG